MENKIISAIEEQLMIGFTGKLNLLDKDSSQVLGCVYFISGKMVNVK